MEEKVQADIAQLQNTEEQIHNYFSQKQQVQAQLLELESATSALEKAKNAYKIVGTVMVEEPASELKAELAEQVERSKRRVTAIEKQEEALRAKAEKLQQAIMKGVKPEEKTSSKKK